MRFWAGVVIGLSVVAIAAAALWYALHASLIVRNMSGGDLTDVTVVVAEARIWSGDIKAGDEISVNFRPQNDSDFRIEGQWQGRRLSSSIGYTTGDDNNVHKVTFMPAGEFAYEFLPARF